MSKGVEHERKAHEMSGKAAEIERQADNAIYSDDVDAIERLQEKIATLEAERDRIKVVNKLIRKDGLAKVGDQLTEAERKELLTLMQISPYHHVEIKGFPSYQLTNLGGNINRLRKRLESLSGSKDATTTPTIAPAGVTATERAGLIIRESMTTPSRPGKSPRPVWIVSGNLAFWRPLLIRLGGTWYQRAFSFWEDPTEAIEAACAETEDDERAKQTPS